MSDKELLELAAKAAGIEHVTPMMIEWGKWNPLTDDGDALRLAVKIGMDVQRFELRVKAFADHAPGHCTENLGNDPYAATRRAIVRAAAEIGKEMK